MTDYYLLWVTPKNTIKINVLNHNLFILLLILSKTFFSFVHKTF